ncbi:Proline-rich nuclear receptor coactivator motif [Sesbania bispinosa]|nr:Proline-rich nuclear receptor coactivator motif [Sesbania bispinosa]
MDAVFTPQAMEQSIAHPNKQIRIKTPKKNGRGPDPKDLPKHLPVVLTSKVVLPGTVGNMEDMFSGSVFNLAPPPSSLPLPKFSLRSKLSCNAEAAAGSVDAGATNNLRRLLRLR